MCFNYLEIRNISLEGNLTVNCLQLKPATVIMVHTSHQRFVFDMLDASALQIAVRNSIFNDSFFNFSATFTSFVTFTSCEFLGTLPTLDNKTAISSKIQRSQNYTGIHAYYPNTGSTHSLRIIQCNFTGLYQRRGSSNPLGGVTVYNVKPDSTVKIQFRDCVFKLNERAIDLSVKGDVDVLVLRCQFHNNFGNGSGGAVRMTGTMQTGLNARSDVKKAKLNVTDSVFRGNFAELSSLYNATSDKYYQTRSPGSGGAIFVFVIVPSQLPKDGIVVVDKSQFHNNSGDVQGGTIFINPEISTSVTSCNFSNTITNVRPKFGDVIYSTCNMTIADCEIHVQTTDGTTPLLSYQASDASNYRLLIQNVSLNCPMGHWVEQLNTSSFAQVGGAALETLQVYCRGCQISEYSLNISSVQFDGKDANISNEIVCTRCPYGAQCSRGILNMNDFWGSTTHFASGKVGTVAMYQCPQEYCTQNNNSNVFYDSCAENRVGTLCGRCANGFSESLFGTNCIPNDQCGWQNWWVAFLLAIYGILYVLFFMFEHDWERFIKWLSKKIKFRKGAPDEFEEKENEVANADLSQTGYFQIFMYFIQTSALLKVKIIIEKDDIYQNVYRPQDLLPTFLIDGIKQVFSFDISFLQDRTCLLPDVNVVTKTGIKLLFVGYCFAMLLVMYFISGFCCVFMSPESRPKVGKLSNTARLIVTLLSLFLYTYQSVAEDAFLLLNCVDVDNKRVLFYDGTVTCVQSWQYYVIALVVIFVIPFFIILLFGPKVLDKQKIGVVVFFLSCVFPLFLAIPITLMYFGVIKFNKKSSRNAIGQVDNTEHKNYCCGSVDHIRNEVVDALTGPYRDDIFKGISYEGILNFRRMIMVVMFTFITDILLKQMALAAACFVILLIHLKAKPFKHQFSNYMESIALSLLLIISGTNLVKAAFYHSQTIPRGINYLIIIIYEWIEAMCLGVLPLAIIFFILVAMIVKTGSNLIHKENNEKKDAKHMNGHGPRPIYFVDENEGHFHRFDKSNKSFVRIIGTLQNASKPLPRTRWKPTYNPSDYSQLHGYRLPRFDDRSLDRSNSNRSPDNPYSSSSGSNERKRLRRLSDNSEDLYSMTHTINTGSSPKRLPRS